MQLDLKGPEASRGLLLFAVQIAKIFLDEDFLRQ